MQYKTLDDVMRAMAIAFPDATLEQDNEGQLIIYTGMKLKDDGTICEVDSD
jgi:hypothetical protein